MSFVARQLSIIGRLRKRLLAYAYVTKRRPMVKVFALIFTVMFGGAILALFIEGAHNSDFHTIGQALWWSVVTMTTVGYGDKIPVTIGGRLLGGVVMFSGVAVISLFTAAISSILVTRRIREVKGLQRIKSKNHILLCGWYQNIEEILSRLRDAVVEHDRSVVMINDLQEDKVEQVLTKHRDIDLRFVRGDYTDESVLDRANVRDAYAAILVPDALRGDNGKPDERTILATLTIKAMQPKVRVFAHILDPLAESHLRRANADRIVVSDRHSGFLLASHVSSPGIPEVLDGLLMGTLGLRLARIEVPSNYLKKRYSDFARHLRTTRNAILLGFLTEEEGMTLEGILSSDYSSIDEFIKHKLMESGRGIGKKATIKINLNPPDTYKIKENDVGVVIESFDFLEK